MKTFFMWIAQTVLKVKGLFSFGSENWNSFEGHSDFFRGWKRRQKCWCDSSTCGRPGPAGVLRQRACRSPWGFGLGAAWRPGGRRSQTMLGLTPDPAIRVMGSHLCWSGEGLLHCHMLERRGEERSNLLRYLLLYTYCMTCKLWFFFRSFFFKRVGRACILSITVFVAQRLTK